MTIEIDVQDRLASLTDDLAARYDADNLTFEHDGVSFGWEADGQEDAFETFTDRYSEMLIDFPNADLWGSVNDEQAYIDVRFSEDAAVADTTEEAEGETEADDEDADDTGDE